MPWMVLLAMGLQTCGRQPDSLQSWPGRGRVIWLACTRLVSGRFACDRRRPAVADVHKPFFGEREEHVPYGAGFQPLESGEVGHRRQRVTWGQLPGADRCPHTIRGLLPFDPAVGRVGPEVRDVAVLGEGLAGAREVAASHQPGVQRVQQRAADLADLAWSRGQG